jgi:hypothetical protein
MQRYHATGAAPGMLTSRAQHTDERGASVLGLCWAGVTLLRF